MTRLAIFDCDGTLVDSGATIFAALEETFADHGLAVPPPRDCRRVIGLSLVEAMQALVPAATGAEHARLTETYKAKFIQARREGRVEEPLFDGIAELLDALAADGWLLGVATGKSLRGLDHCLARHGLADALHFAPDRRPAPVQAAPVDGAAGDGRCRRRCRNRPSSSATRRSTWPWRAPPARPAIGAGWGYHDAQRVAGRGRGRRSPSQPLDVPQLIATAREAIDG